jgi:3-hydroxyisobutyrate dehydrogenase
MTQDPTVTMIGAGALGAAMAARLGETGHQVRLWNRSAERAQSAAQGAQGVTAVDDLSDAVGGSPVVFTVLRDGDAVAEVMADGIDRLEDGAVWVQASTIGPEHARSLARLADEHGVSYLDAPVSGSTTPARQGKLVWLVAGSDEALDRVRPVLDALGTTVLHVGTGVEGSALKLAVNAWMATATVA